MVIPGCCVLVGLAGCLMFTILQSYGISMTVVDVGQGQCLMLSNGTQHVMIDCGGSDGESSGDLAAWELMKIGALRLDALILTHYDRDHCNGVPELLHRITVTAIFLPDMEPENDLRCQIEETAEMMGIEVCYVNTKVSVSFGGGTVTLLPMLDDQMGDNIGLCAVCNMEKFQALVTDDLDVAMEQLLLEEYDIPAVDILVAGHHGSASSTSQALLEAVTPKVVVISVGENSYGHPAEETLRRIKTCGAAVYRTDLYGTLTLKGG